MREVITRDDAMELAVSDAPARLDERNGTPVIALAEPSAPLTADAARGVIDRVRQ